MCIRDRYTVDLYNFYIEMLSLDSDEPVKPGELGRIVVTDFYNKAFPMIRYDTCLLYTSGAGHKHNYGQTDPGVSG